MHFDQNLVFVVILAIIGISRLIARVIENAREQSNRANKRAASSKPVVDRSRKTDEERVREFLEALGQPPQTPPPRKVIPRTSTPPRPLAPISPPSIGRPFSPSLPRRAAQRARRTAPPPVLAESTTRTLETNAPGAWIAEEGKTEAAAAKVRAARTGTAEESQVAPTSSEAIWRQMLHSTEPLRSAIVLREIFGPPRGLRPLDLAG